MSTRATYLIASSFWNQRKICFYIHHDGYAEGAAGYFYNMYKAQNNSEGGFAEHFIRGNRNAEFTKSHSTHADTQYRYTLDLDGILLAEKAEYSAIEDQYIWKTFYSGLWYDFVNHYAKLSAEDRLYTFTFPDSKFPQIMTLREARELVSHELTYSKSARERGWESVSIRASDKAAHISRQIDKIVSTFK